MNLSRLQAALAALFLGLLAAGLAAAAPQAPAQDLHALFLFTNVDRKPFFRSIGMHRLLPPEIERTVKLDFDVRFEANPYLLFQEFDRFRWSRGPWRPFLRSI